VVKTFKKLAATAQADVQHELRIARARRRQKIIRRPGDHRWAALFVLCGGSLMIVLDSTIVNVALPSIRDSLHFSPDALAWVVNAYLLTFGGFLLLGGRLGDLFGHKKVFLVGLILFTVASLGCGLSQSALILTIARAIQGLGGAVVSAVGLSLIMDLFVASAERARAMGFFGFVSAGGGSVGVLLGGLLTSFLSWHWIFFINVPIGVLVYWLSLKYLPAARKTTTARHLDAWGAVTITSALLLTVYAVVNGNAAGWHSFQTVGILSLAAILFGIFLRVEASSRRPLMPLGLFKLQNLPVANSAAVLWAAAMFAWFFLSALYLGAILGFSPLQVGLSFLPANIIMAIFSVGLSARLVNRFGIKKPLVVGLVIAASGLLWFARAPVGGNFWTDVLPSMVVLGFGAGMAFNPMLLAAMSGVRPEDSGLASGIVNTSFMMGGAVGLAVLTSIAAAATATMLALGGTQTEALNGGYNVAFLVGGMFALLAAILCAFFVRSDTAYAEN
jgi:EmrB/QacA subfamily drug resistance transporter